MGQEVLLFIRPHMSEPFFTVNLVGDVTDSKAANFKADVAEAKRVAKLIAEPTGSTRNSPAPGGLAFVAVSAIVPATSGDRIMKTRSRHPERE